MPFLLGSRKNRNPITPIIGGEGVYKVMKTDPAWWVLRAILSIVLLSGSTRAANAASVFNFDGDPVGRGTEFSDTSNGISATFSSPGDPGGFGVQQSFLSGLTGNVLVDPGPAGLDRLPLTVRFSSPVDRVDLDFAVNATNPVPLTLTAFFDGATVATAAANGAFPSADSQSREGHISLYEVPFDSITLSSDANDFAIDNITVAETSSAPEPASFWLFGSAIALAGTYPMAKRHRRR
jgi:hypothetical protein